jgi:hypothetical protein
MALGQAAHRERSRLHSRQARERDVLPSENEGVVDFVGEDDEIVFLGDGRDASICARVMTRPVGLLGEQRSSARDFGVTARSIASGVGMKPSSSVVGRWTATPSCCAILVEVRREAGFRGDDLVAGFEKRLKREVERLHAARHDENLIGVDFRP